jgi:hypothetical protein
MLRVAERRNSPLRRPRNALPRDEQHPHHNQLQVGQHRGANRMHDLARIRPAAQLTRPRTTTAGYRTYTCAVAHRIGDCASRRDTAERALRLHLSHATRVYPSADEHRVVAVGDNAIQVVGTKAAMASPRWNRRPNR